MLAWGKCSTLCATPFSALGTPSGVRLNIGARRFEYTEVYYYGNPGGYQHFIWSFNDAGVGDLAAFGELSQASIYRHSDGIFVGEHGVESRLPTEIQNFRAQTSPNTFTVIGPTGKPLGLEQEGWIGIDKDRVRTLRVT